MDFCRYHSLSGAWLDRVMCLSGIEFNQHTQDWKYWFAVGTQTHNEIDKNLIPEGEYCYESLEITTRADGMPTMQIKPCPYYIACKYAGRRSIDGWCRAMEWEVVDECKSCNINFEEEEINF